MKRVLLKLSGEALAGEQKRGFDEATVTEVAKQIKTIVDEGLQVGIVSEEETSGEDVPAGQWTEVRLTRSVCLLQS